MKTKTQLDICKKADISSGFLSLVLAGERRPSWGTAKRLARAVPNTTPEQWLEESPETLRGIVKAFMEGEASING